MNWADIEMGLRRRYFRREFDLLCRAVLRTPPVELDKASDVVVLSQSYHKDLLMYLVAAKSFARYVRPSRFVVVDDGFTPDDREVLKTHLRQVDFIPRRRVFSESCPAGGTWERLLSIADLCSKHYVIQLDSDTVTFTDPVEVKGHIARNASFTLSTKQGRDFVTVEQAAAAVAASDSEHIQVIAERTLGRLPEVTGKHYIRGCSGFAGFARGSLNRGVVEHFSSLMSGSIGASLWRSWGSEQFASNYLIANSAKKGLLPFEGYPYWEPECVLQHARLVHFIGDHRFTSSAYRRLAMQAIRNL